MESLSKAMFRIVVGAVVIICIRGQNTPDVSLEVNSDPLQPFTLQPILEPGNISLEDSDLIRHAGGPHSKECSSNVAGDKELRTAALTRTLPLSLHESEYWYQFLNNLYCNFSKQKLKVMRRQYTVSDDKDLGNQVYVSKECDIQDYMDSKAERVYFDNSNVERFLNRTIECNLVEHDSIKKIRFTSAHFDELNHILNFALNDALQVNCDGQNIFFKGNYVTTRDVVLKFLFLEWTGENKNCRNLLLNEASKTINIFATNTFFINFDISFTFTQKHNISKMNIIAPKWFVNGTHIVNLKGKNGKLPVKNSGKDGNPGKPGGPGGNFFGIGNEFINGKDLVISVNGGDGSDGHRGDDGRRGRDGLSPTVPSNLGCYDTYCNGNGFSHFHCEKYYCHYKEVIALFFTSRQVEVCLYQIFGETGTIGRNGGKGGKGGPGGYSGKIELFDLNNRSSITLLNNTGINGTNGKGGLGGIGGKKGNEIIVKCEPGFFKTYWSLYRTKFLNERAQSGLNGPDGANTNGMGNLSLPVEVNDLEKAKIINQYKSFIRENVFGHFKLFFLSKFLNVLDENKQVKSVYDTFGFIDEFQSLEEQLHKLNKNISFLPFYQSLLIRTSEYAEVLLKVDDTSAYKKVLRYLYTTIQSRIYNMEDTLEADLITDISAYLKFVKEDIDKLNNIENEMYKNELINKYKDEYKYQLDLKIQEAEKLISEEIMPALDFIGTDIDILVDKWLFEIIYLQNQTRIEESQLIWKQQQLENSMTEQSYMSIINIHGLVISFFGSEEGGIGQIIGIGTSIAENFISENSNDQNKVSQFPQAVPGFESLKKMIKDIINQRVTCFKTSLENMLKEINKYPIILSNLHSKIVTLKVQLDKWDKNWFDFHKIQNFESEIQVLEKELEELLQIHEGDSDEENAMKLSVLDIVKTYFQLCTLFPEIYSKYAKDTPEFHAIGHAIRQNEYKFQKLKRCEEKIINSIIPRLQIIQNNIYGTVDKLSIKSEVALDVVVWHIKSTLEDMILHIQEVTEGDEVQRNIVRCIEKLKETMKTLINLYDHIRDYQKYQNLANLIAKIGSISVTGINIAKYPKLQEELRDVVRNLEKTIMSNLVVQRHKVAINAFKQFVFPFANDYFKDLVLPAHLEIKDDNSNATLDDLISRAATEIDKINSKLEKYKISVTKRDGCIGIGPFKSGYVSSKPFFVWKNEEYSSMIYKLLSGEAVTITADVRFSAADKDAIKFKVAEFHFKSTNRTLQAEIDTKLKEFQFFAIHLGNSYYRYENKIYKMMTPSRLVWYYFEKSDGEPFYSNSYSKFMNSTLSPYASWKTKLDTAADNTSFKYLEMYKDDVDLVLEGRGYFINKKSMHCEDLMVEKYYKAIHEHTPTDSNVETNV